ncbi:MAG TPA: hypothetical protein VM509_06250 [Planctomycetota bacterium]|nr:hypothetical protein [Planctomycetota bacterium]
MKIHDVPHGLNVVIETNSARVYIGRFDSTSGFTALLHDVDVHDVQPGADPEPYIRETALYGVDVKSRDLEIDVLDIKRIRLLRDIPKP